METAAVVVFAEHEYLLCSGVPVCAETFHIFQDRGSSRVIKFVLEAEHCLCPPAILSDPRRGLRRHTAEGKGGEHQTG